MNTIDLSKISVKETAKGTVKANFEGTEKEYSIRALTDGEKANMDSLLVVSRDVFRVRNMYVFLLSCGLDIEQPVASFLFDNCTEEAMKVGDAVYELSRSFDEAKETEAKAAEKNSAGGTVQP